MRGLAIRLLGSPLVALDGAVMRFDTRKAVALLAYLATTQRAHSREALAALLWPEYADARSALRRTLSTLQHGIGTGWLAVERDTIGLVERPDLWIDVADFVAQCHPAAAIEPLAAALALYRDDFLAGFTLRDSLGFDEWQLFEAEWLRQRFALGLERLSELYAASGAYQAALEPARRRLALDPLYEPAHRTLMRLYAAVGQRTAALRQYRACAQRLEQEFGATPADETVALYRAIQASVGAMPSVPPAEAPILAARAVPREEPFATPLIGRADEFGRLLREYRERTSNLVALTGQPGVGKTRLAEELLAEVGQAGGALLSARCYEGEHVLAYAPIVTLLRAALDLLERTGRLDTIDASQLAEVVRLVPDLARQLVVPEAAPLTGPEVRRRFFAAVAELLFSACAGPVAGVILIDDAHWADSASLDLLAFIARRLPEQAGLLLLTWRDEEVPADHPLRAILAEQRRSGRAELIELSPLTADEVAALAHASGTRLAPALMARLADESEGLPLLVIEYAAMLREHDLAEQGTWPLPRRARDLFEARLRPLAEHERGLLSAAAVLGRAFDLPTLCATAALAEEAAITGLETLLGRGLLSETSVAPLRFAFSHEQLRAVAYERLSTPRRGLLHRRVADYLARQRAAAPRLGLAAHVAYHAAAAGEPQLAAAHHRLAGDEARALAANGEALAHYAAALALGAPEAAELHEHLGDLLALAGDYASALAHYEATRRLIPTGRAVAQKVGAVYHCLGAWEEAAAQFSAVLNDNAASHAERALALAAWSMTARRSGDLAHATQLAAQALQLSAIAGEPRAAARAHGAAGALAAHQGDEAAARTHLERGLALAEQCDDAETLVAALNRLALALASSDPPRAKALAERALALCLARDDRHRAAALHNTLADLAHASGEDEVARAHLREAVTLFAAIGHDQPAIWMLTEW